MNTSRQNTRSVHKTALLLSGGVDSSVALRLLLEKGNPVTAFYLKIWLQDDLAFLGDCPWEEDLRYAGAVCKQAGVPLEIISLQREYWDLVVSYALKELKAGRTPNSDVFCNSLIKFGVFIDKIGASFRKVASGHYARVEQQNGKYLLKQTDDPVKDQTYFLSYLQQRQLSRLLFPLGDYTKKEVRALAQKWNLPNKNRKDSQGICFLGQFRYRDFVKFHLGEKPGDFIEAGTGKKLGQHQGYWFYTIGQRQGLGLSGGPWYVVRKEPGSNTVWLSHRRYVENIPADSFGLKDLSWISGKWPELKDLKVKIRHGPEFIKCRIEKTGDAEGIVYLERPDNGIAGGQFAALYREEVCLGAGIINEIEFG
ncbi:MAG: tRNA 2-thiouridine(34) synthase MnmA [Calditrichia bacterium]